MKYFLLVLILAATLFSCSEKYTPKPRGYFRIDFPEKKYKTSDTTFPYIFEIPVYSEITQDKQNPDKPFWVNVTIPANRAEIHISYYKLSQNNNQKRNMIGEFMEETRRLAYKHSIKANAIEEQLFFNPKENTFGTIYKIQGNAASPVQFFLTDSTNHFLRGALYIREVPNIDSLKPVINFLEPDVIRLIETTRWN
jgi:gliding motility-associated lipoprotein GldD